MNKIKKLTAFLLVVITLFTCVPMTHPVKAVSYNPTPYDNKTLTDFDTPSKIFGDYDEGFGFAVKLYAYLFGSSLSADSMWDKIYYDLLYKTFTTNQSSYTFNKNIDEVQQIEQWLSDVVSFSVDLIGKSNPTFDAANTLANIMLDVSQDVVVSTFVKLDPLLYLAENASNSNIKNAANELLSFICNNTLTDIITEIGKKAVDSGLKIDTKELSSAFKTALETVKFDDVAPYVSRLLSVVNITLTVKDLIFFATGQGEMLDGYINLIADGYLKTELKKYRTYLHSNCADQEKMDNALMDIIFVTQDAYKNFEIMMGADTFNKILESDEYLKKEYDKIYGITASNYVSGESNLMVPEWDGSRLYLYPEMKTYEFKLPGTRYGVPQYYEFASDSNCLEIDKDTGVITLTGKEGTGTLGVVIYQNGENHEFYIPVKVAHVEDSAYLKNEKYTSNSIQLKWGQSSNAQYYALFQKVNGSWKMIAKDLTDTTALIKNLKPGTTYTYCVRPYAVVDKVVYWAKNYTELTTATGPVTPSNFKKVSVTESSANMTWSSSQGATGYRIFVYNKTTGKWDIAVKSVKSTSCTIPSLKENTNYIFAVRAYYNNGKEIFWSPSFPVASVTTAGIPNAPTNLTVSDSSDSSVTLSWKKGANASGYYIYKYNTTTKKWEKLTSTKSTSAKITGLSENTVYSFAVRSYNNVGTKVLLSKTFPTIKAVVGLTAPKTVTAYNNKTTSVSLKWDKVSAATGYRIFVYNTDTKSWDIAVKSTNKTYTTVSSLKPGTNYIFAVRPYFNTGSNILWANGFTKVDTNTLIDKVTNFTGTVSGSKATFTWNNVNGADGYVIYSYDPSTEKYTTEVISTGNTATINNLTKTNTKYYYVVRAYKKGSSVFYSEKSSVLTLLTLPSDKEVAYMYNKAYTVAKNWFSFCTNGYADFSKCVTVNDIEYIKINHSTIDTTTKLKNYLSNYFSTSLINSECFYNNNFKDINGKLYVQGKYAGDALPTYYLNNTTASLYSSYGNKYTYKISIRLQYPWENTFEYRTKNCILISENNKWVFYNGFNIGLYSPYIWDYKSPLN